MLPNLKIKSSGIFIMLSVEDMLKNGAELDAKIRKLDARKTLLT